MDFKFLESSDLITLVLLLFSFIVFIYIYKSYKDNFKILFTLRIFLITILIFSLFNPVINYSTEKQNILQWALFFDNSASMKYHKTPSLNSINLGIEELENRLNKEKVSFSSYSFDSKVSPLKNKLNGNGESTNIGNVAEYILQNENKLAGVILATDGIPTEGSNPLNAFKNSELPIFSLGIGNKSSLIDIFINSIDAPTVAIKNERIDVAIDIQSIGRINDQFSISLYDDSKMIGSKYVKLYGLGSTTTVNFQFEPKSLGRQKYRVQVSSVEDEVNIINNKQNFELLILKDRYKIALLTGSPNKNTSIIKKSLNSDRVQVDHFIKISDAEFNKSIKSFWQSSYDLIIFENYPIEPLPISFIRILAKKILSHQSALMLIAGPNQINESIKGLTSVLGLEELNEADDSENINYWEFTDSKIDMTDLPPLSQKLFINNSQKESKPIAIFDSGWPLLLRNIKGKIRTITLTSSDLNKLYFYKNGYNAFANIFYDSIDWLLKSGVSSENYFRLNRDYYQQGEMAFIMGSRISQIDLDSTKFYLNILDKNKVLFSKEIEYNIEKNRWECEFRTPSPGDYLFQIQMNKNKKPIQSTSFSVLESQIELNQVYLNEKLLMDISMINEGSYYNWDNKAKIFDHISQKGKREIKANVIKFKDNIFILSLVIIFLCIEWIARKQKGLF